jgi:hypothetical protein
LSEACSSVFEDFLDRKSFGIAFFHGCSGPGKTCVIKP